MSQRFLGMTTLLAASIAVAPASLAAPKTQCAPTAPESVAETMRDMYAALMVDDDAKLQKNFAPDFYAIDGGKPFDGASLARLVKDAHKGGSTFVWTVNEPKVHLQCDWAWITYINRGSITDASGTKPVTWLESAILRYDTDRWRIAFFHSSRAAPMP